MVESVIDAFWIDTKCMQGISFSLSIGTLCLSIGCWFLRFVVYIRVFYDIIL